jgi:hypothetical protein
MHAIDTFKVGDRQVKIFPDGDCASPREDDNLGTIVYTSTRYRLGDTRLEGYQIKDLEDSPDTAVWLPVYAYIHSGIALNTTGFSCPWDSGQCGIIYVTVDKLIKEYGADTPENRVLAEKVLRAEVETFGEFVGGECYGYVVEDPDGEEVDACWGFIGFDSVKQAAREAAAQGVTV